MPGQAQLSTPPDLLLVDGQGVTYHVEGRVCGDAAEGVLRSASGQAEFELYWDEDDGQMYFDLLADTGDATYAVQTAAGAAVPPLPEPEPATYIGMLGEGWATLSLKQYCTLFEGEIIDTNGDRYGITTGIRLHVPLPGAAPLTSDGVLIDRQTGTQLPIALVQEEDTLTVTLILPEAGKEPMRVPIYFRRQAE